ncbi:MAG: ATP-binding cassette domain-containing protein [Deltaproteobacteria bacterium]|nr:ATP-binding cassette domain-containing protein [Deltaproteobacteria bacterium]
MPQLLDFDHALPYSVADFLTIMMRRRPVFLGRSPSFNDAIRKNLAMTGADHLANRLIGGLSGGELRRVLLAQALVLEPEVLLLDEPASNIDEIGARAFADTLRRLRDETGVAVLMVGHDIETIVRIADRVTGLNRHVTHTGPAESLRDAAVLGRVFGAQAAEFSRSEPAR